MKLLPLSLRALISFILILGISGLVFAETSKTGIVIMHGKGGSPSKHVDRISSTLEKDGYLVKNLEMPWSKKREYNAPVSTAVEEVDKAIESMRAQGATHIFVSGHSMGAAFALHYATMRDVDGIIGLAPGGNMGATVFRKKLGKYVSKARKLIAEGKGDTTTSLMDFEGSKGTFSVIVTPSNYLSWFDPEGAMNMIKSAGQLRSDVAVLWAVAERDYKGLKKFGPKLFNNYLSAQPHATYYEPKSDHLGAPSASIDEVKRWVAQVTGSDNKKSLQTQSANQDQPTSPQERKAWKRAGIVLEKFDSDGDGGITKDEAPSKMKANFSRLDKNGDGSLSEVELRSLPPRQ